MIANNRSLLIRRWTSSLASFLEHLNRHFSKRVVSEQSPGSYEESSDDEDLDVDAPPPVANGHSSRSKLSKATQQRVAKLIAKLASRAQYAKVLSLLSPPPPLSRSYTEGFALNNPDTKTSFMAAKW